MHEMSVAEALIEQVAREVERLGCPGPVVRVDLAVGKLSGVHCDALRFALEMLAPGTVVEGAELRISEPPAKCCCRHCGAETELDEVVFCCPHCQSPAVRIEGGRELVLESIEVADDPPRRPEPSAG
ncbi:MAG TPA: hydrogenase maturation nickel metallochaperone HypA [Planctomycetes bacterium]|nr:hydrogenase maturation nickel metallochaperone HypA [Planctomycetota bacterium]